MTMLHVACVCLVAPRARFGRQEGLRGAGLVPALAARPRGAGASPDDRPGAVAELLEGSKQLDMA